MQLGEILLDVKQDEDGLWYIYSSHTGNKITSCGPNNSEQEAKQAAIDFFDA